jgi:hypothetical protein
MRKSQVNTELSPHKLLAKRLLLVSHAVDTQYPFNVNTTTSYTTSNAVNANKCFQHVFKGLVSTPILIRQDAKVQLPALPHAGHTNTVGQNDIGSTLKIKPLNPVIIDIKKTPSKPSAALMQGHKSSPIRLLG